MTGRVLIIGATSRIAIETARALLDRGPRQFFLVGRDSERLEATARDLAVRGANGVGTYAMDLTKEDLHLEMFDQARAQLGEIDVVLIAHGTLPDQVACESNPILTRATFDTNCMSVIALLVPLANYFESRGAGVLAVVSSVAGERGRKSNYTYGAAKAAVTTYMEGLRNRLHGTGVRVVTIKPGMVDTPMTAHLAKSTLLADPARVGVALARTIDQPRDVVYLPGYWRGIMALIRAIPERVFKRLKL